MRFSVNTVFAMLALTASAVSAAPTDAAAADVDSPSVGNVEGASNAFWYYAQQTWFDRVFSPNQCYTFELFSANAVTYVAVRAGYTCQVFVGPYCTGRFDLIVGAGEGNGNTQPLSVANLDNLSWRCT
ncbi:hypothetical protein CVT25_009154 [Psilocybe cyanescens]|uniref:Uncharacterized protein n=1 Tax=Psilocybe cyanescens TaxID=93625 RepID=A0A409XDQ4_PSICY|nr:hypothetical protein CVT25_009154 [Psilocybe cyanescens]